MNLGRSTNSPPYSVRVFTTCQLAVSVAGARVLAFVALSLAVVNSEPSLGCADEEDEEVIVAPAARQYVITEQQFDQMVFGGHLTTQRAQVVPQANGGQVLQVVQANVKQSPADFRKRMEGLAATELDVVDRRVSLTEAQKKKLKLAARGDIEQHISRANELRPKLTSKPLDQAQYVELMDELRPLRMVLQTGLVSESSLFRKTLRHCLTDNQRARWQTLERERQQAVIESVIQTWERTAKQGMLWGESRKQFIEVPLDHGDLPDTHNSYNYYVVLVEVGKLEDRLKPLVSEEVWEKLQKQITQARQIEASLRKSGQWPERARDDDVADSKIDGVKD